MDGNELTPEEEEAARRRIQEAARHPYVYDPDSPLITEEYLEAQVKKRGELSPEQVERIKAAQKRHASIDPACVNLTPEEFVNWHPVGGISWEERERRMNEVGVIDMEKAPVMAVGK
jgi:hypothetical protein